VIESGKDVIREAESVTIAVGLILMNSTCAFGQAFSVATLKVELQDLVYYEVDTPDFSKFGTNAKPVHREFISYTAIGV
jgi:hypothetical protein